MTESSMRSSELNTDVPHIARVYDYWLGGKDNFAADREAGDAAIREDPNVVEGVRGNRAFLARTTRFLAGEAGIRQFLDIGTGIPAANNTHEVAQAVAPESRIVYVDNDPIVLVHARALLKGDPAGATAYIDADLRDADKILQEAAATLDFTKPVAVMLIGILHCIPNEDDPAGIVARLMSAVPAGSYLTISHPARDINTTQTPRLASRLNELMPNKLTFRTRPDVESYFAGLHLVEPGIVRVPDWRPDAEADRANPAAVWGGVAQKR